MINVRQGIVDLLKASNAITAPVYSTRVDKFKAKNCPAISVLNISTTRNQISHHLQFQASTSVGIIVMVAQTTGYDTLLDTLEQSILTVLFTDEQWQQEWEEVPQVQSVYDYDDAGETNIAQAKIVITVQYTDEYPVDIQDDFDKIHIDVDMSEADGVIDTQTDIDLSIL